MESILELDNCQLWLERYPKTEDKSLRAWSNAELLVLDYIKDLPETDIHLYNDRFGVWNCALAKQTLVTVYTHASQQKAVKRNLELNKLSTQIVYKTPLDVLDNVELALVKVPKSLELFELFLQQIHTSSLSNTTVVCGFMTKYYSASMLTIAEKYFNVIEQTKAWKKARLLILKQPKKRVEEKVLLNTIPFEGNEFKQYFGVFSSGQIDIGTQFFLKHLLVKENEGKVLDLASGNGVIAHRVAELNPYAEVTLLDDFYLAVESSKLNLKNKRAVFLCNDTLEGISNNSFDLVVSNPPFHFEFENNIEVALNLFTMVAACLRPTGRFVLVANKHLNYKTHLVKLFNQVIVIAENNKFVIYECTGKEND